MFRSAKTSDKRILLFTNEDDPFRNIKGVTKLDMTRTTLQRAKVGSFALIGQTSFGLKYYSDVIMFCFFFLFRMHEILASPLNYFL